MSDIAIKVENLSKLYQLGSIGTGTLGNDLKRWWAQKRGKEDPFAKIGQINDRTKKTESEFVWALKDIDFEVKQGEVLGIIGRNGAGKSTLLKILSKITSPTTGKIKTNGRIASLLEVGTGFHPDLSGRDNIFMNGAILGMRKWEVEKKFDEIVDFSGVEAYIDTPVKRYSSGMYVRLAFAVAAFLEPEILVIDEVLAVGDAEFQKKCIGRMQDISKKDGRTILFVSHNIGAVKQLTSTALLLENGELMVQGVTRDVFEVYNSSQQSKPGDLIFNSSNWKPFEASHLLREITIREIQFSSCNYTEGESLKFRMIIDNHLEKQIQNIHVGVRAMTYSDQVVGTWFTNEGFEIASCDQVIKELCIDSLNLANGKYYFTVWVGLGNYKNYGVDFDSVDKVMSIEVSLSSNNSSTPVWNSEAWEIQFSRI